jgi:hypothetical protein
LKKIDQMLPQALGHEEVLRAGRAQNALRQWPEIVGPLLAERSRPDRFDRGTVWVAVEGSAWAQELRMMKDLILERLNRAAGEPLFTNVRFGVRPLPQESVAEVDAPTDAPSEPTETPEELSIGEIARRRLANWADERRRT